MTTMTPTKADKPARAPRKPVKKAAAPNSPVDEMLRIDEVAHILACSVGAVNRLVKNRQIPTIKLGPIRRFSKRAVLAWIARNTQDVAETDVA